MAKKKKFDVVKTMVEIGVMAALGFVLDELAGIIFKGVFVNGGSIGIAMVCVLVMAFRRGFVPALLTGLVMGLLDLATGPYIIPGDAWRAFLQVFLDYVAAYPMVAFAACFRPLFLKSESSKMKVTWLCVGTVVGGLLKLLSHFLSGILFWADPSGFAFSWNWMNPYLYCFAYNALYVIPCIILSLGFLLVLYWRIPNLLKDPDYLYTRKKNNVDEKEGK